MNPEMFFPSDGSQEWLDRADARLAVHLLARDAKSTVRVLEIGVWKGAWTSVVLSNLPHCSVVGVDPYPRLGNIRTEMLGRLERLGLQGRFELFTSTQDVPDGVHFDLIHIDGEHSEAAADRDLSYAKDHLTDEGIIVMDDYRNSWFPGVTSALFLFCRDHGFRIFLVTKDKAYVARSPHASRLHETLLRELDNDTEVLLHRYLQEKGSSPPEYVQRTDVLGQPVLIAQRAAEKESMAKRMTRGAMPPILWRWFKRMFRSA